MGFLTTGELAFAVPAGVILGAAISYLGARLSSKTMIEAQIRLARNKRGSDLYDKMAEASTDMIHLLLKQPYPPKNIFYSFDGSSFLTQLDHWFAELRAAAALLFAYGSEDVRGGLHEDLKTIENTISMVKLQVTALLQTRDTNMQKPGAVVTANMAKMEKDWQADYAQIWKINAALETKLRKSLTDERT